MSEENDAPVDDQMHLHPARRVYRKEDPFEGARFHVGMHPMYHELRRDDDETRIGKKYAAELAAASTVDLLTAHLNRWAFALPRWLPEVYAGMTPEGCTHLLDLLGPESLFRREDHPGWTESIVEQDDTAAVAIHILVPILLLDLTLVADHWGVPMHVAMHQALCDSTDHERCF